MSTGSPARPFLLPVLWGYTRERDPDLLIYPDDDFDQRALAVIREHVPSLR